MRGFESGLLAQNGSGWLIENSDFSDNFTNPDFWWGEYKNVGGIILENISQSSIRNNRATNVWNGLDLRRCSFISVVSNNFSRCSNVCLKLWDASHNRFSNNNFSYGLRIKPGEVHARDSAGVLIEHDSNDNYFFNNDVTHGGDGIFVRSLDSCVSRRNLFIKNDCSYAHNNGFEAWCPDNTYISNTANYCSYGFWMGGSDNSTLIANEAGFNGRKAGQNNAPEPDFGHGGIVFVGESSSHTVLRDNFCHDNAGGGIVLRGDTRSNGVDWRAFHWIIQNNRLERNKWPIFARLADMILLSGNSCLSNQSPAHFDDVTNRLELKSPSPALPVPLARLSGPSLLAAGDTAVFDASASSDPSGRPLSFQWDINGPCSNTPLISRTFVNPGFYRVALTVNNGSSAAMAFKNVYVIDPPATNSYPWLWSLTDFSNISHPVQWHSDATGICTRSSLLISPRFDKAAVLTGICDVSNMVPANATSLVFWIKFKFSCVSEFRWANPMVSFVLTNRTVTFKPMARNGRERSLFLKPLFSEARWGWQRVEIPLNAGGMWSKDDQLPFSPKDITALKFTIREHRRATYDIWLDNLHFE